MRRSFGARGRAFWLVGGDCCLRKRWERGMGEGWCYCCCSSRGDRGVAAFINYYPINMESGTETYLQLIQSIESIIAIRDSRIHLHLRSRIVRITHRPRLRLYFPLAERDILPTVEIPRTSSPHNNRSALDLCQLYSLSRSEGCRQINLNNIMLLDMFLISTRKKFQHSVSGLRHRSAS
jgi:hypothetical protein